MFSRQLRWRLLCTVSKRKGEVVDRNDDGMHYGVAADGCGYADVRRGHLGKWGKRSFLYLPFGRDCGWFYAFGNWYTEEETIRQHNENTKRNNTNGNLKMTKTGKGTSSWRYKMTAHNMLLINSFSQG